MNVAISAYHLWDMVLRETSKIELELIALRRVSRSERLMVVIVIHQQSGLRFLVVTVCQK